MNTGNASWHIGPEVMVQVPTDNLLVPHVDEVFSLSRCYTTPTFKPRYVLYLEAHHAKDETIQVLADDLPVFHAIAERELPPLLEKTLAHYCARMCEDYAIFHAAFLAKGDQGILLPGEPGSGKSTLCAHLTEQGYRYFGDDFIFMRFDDLEIHAFPKAVTLKRGSFDYVADAPEFLDRARGAIRYFTPKSGGNDVMDAKDLHSIILPHYVSGGINQTQRVPPEVAALAMVQQCFGGLERDPRMLDTIERLVQKPAYLIDYSSSDTASDAIKKILEEGHS